MKNRECKWYVYCSSGQTLDSLEEKELGKRGFLPGLLTGCVELGLKVVKRAAGQGITQKTWDPAPSQ